MPGGPGSSHGLAAHSLCGAGDLPSCLDLLLPFFSQARDSCPTGLFADLLGMGGGLSVPSHFGTFVLHGEGRQVNVGPGTLRVAPISDPMRFLACSLSSPEAGQGQDLRPWEQMDQIWPQT